MAEKGHGGPRYPKHRPRHGPETFDAAGASLGAAMFPADIFIVTRQLAGLDDKEAAAVMRLGALRVFDELEADDGRRPSLAEIGEIEQRRAVEAAMEVTPARVVAWRRRHREMTWPELRIWLIGLKQTVLGGDPARDDE